MTCFDRRDTTARCLRALRAQEGIDDVRVQVYLVDDGCTDGTGQMVRDSFPEVNVLQGTGDLYWCGGMALADDIARQTKPDYMLWLNDDVVLSPTAVRELLDTATMSDDVTVVVGSLRHSASGGQTYGGFTVTRPGDPFARMRVLPNGLVQDADTFNGNLVLVPRVVRERVGALDTRLRHNMADIDFGFRVRESGFRVVVCPSYVGECAEDPSRNAWHDPSVPVWTRMRKVASAKVFPPRARYVFVRKHCGWRWSFAFVSPYARALMPALYERRRKHRGFMRLE